MGAFSTRRAALQRGSPGTGRRAGSSGGRWMIVGVGGGGWGFLDFVWGGGGGGGGGGGAAAAAADADADADVVEVVMSALEEEAIPLAACVAE